MVRQSNVNVDKLNILDKQRWWGIFSPVSVLRLLSTPNTNILSGEIVSMHYADDAIITIEKNQCFKEVIKDLTAFEQASGTKVNYGKTKGLWAGAWKNRTDKPINIKWTNKNVETLGVYFDNDNPAGEAFTEIHPFYELLETISFM